jgi:hypothetical protein
MTEKAQAVLQKMKLWRLFPSRSSEPASEPGSTAGGDQEMSILNESNDFQSDHDAFVKSLAPSVDVL